jgi:fused signal recognition particle receptor
LVHWNGSGSEDEPERVAAAETAEAERVAKETADAERVAAEKAEAERVATEETQAKDAGRVETRLTNAARRPVAADQSCEECRWWLAGREGEGVQQHVSVCSV